MADLATQKVILPSLTPALVAAAGGGDTAECGEDTFLVVKNASGGAITVTVEAYPDTSDWGTAIPNLTVSVPATTGERWIGPLSPRLFANPTTGRAAVSYSGVTSLTVGCFKVGNN
jgi:hypothetical protein